jgi:hypothetical protein
MIRSFPPHPNPLPPGERGGHSSPQQSWEVFWHVFIKLRAISTFKLQIEQKQGQISTSEFDLWNGSLTFIYLL